MNIYFIRHSEAEPPGAKDDFNRELTPRGTYAITAAAKGWKNFIRPFDSIFTSPYVRAMQTATIIREVYGLEKELLIDPRLASGSRIGEIINMIVSDGGHNIALVGHEPDMSRNIAVFCSENNLHTVFPTAAIAKVSFEAKVRASLGRLDFFIPAETFMNGKE